MSDLTTNMFVVGNNLLSFYPGATKEEKEDIQDALLFADLQASETFDRKQNWGPWINLHQQRLSGVGLSRMSSIEHKPVKVSKRADFSKRTSTLIHSIASPRLADVARKALYAMQNSEHAQQFYTSWFSAGRSDSFQIVPCEKMPDGSINIMVCGLQMTTLTKPKLIIPIGIFPTWPLAYEMTIVMKGGLFAYHLSRYALHRERVNGELAKKVNEAVKRIDL